MGSGKTTVGRALAKRLNKRFFDSDHEIEARTGASIPLIFEIEGEASFRQREADMIRDLTACEGVVLATGGGSILNPQSRAYLKSRGLVIYRLVQPTVASVRGWPLASRSCALWVDPAAQTTIVPAILS